MQYMQYMCANLQYLPYMQQWGENEAAKGTEMGPQDRLRSARCGSWPQLSARRWPFATCSVWLAAPRPGGGRAEEGGVGKECRARWAP